MDAVEFQPRSRGRILALLLLVTVAIGACSKKTPEPTTAKLPADKPTWMRGLLVMRPGMQVFHTCDDTTAFWVEDRASGDLTFAFEQLGTGPDRPMYVEILAQPMPVPAQGAGASRRQALAVTGLRLAAFASEDGGCDPERATYEYRARGNEPFWSVTVTRQAIVFAQPDDPTRIDFPYVASTMNGHRRFYTTRTPGSRPHTLEFWIEDRRCTDTMAGEILPYVAIAKFDGRTMQGCALDGDLAPANAFAAVDPVTAGETPTPDPPPLFGQAAGAPRSGPQTKVQLPPGGASLAYFEHFVGQKPLDVGLWRSHPLAPRLYSMLGPRYNDLLINMQEAEPIARDQNLYWVLGHKMMAPQEQAALVVDMDQDLIYIWLLIAGQAMDYREGGHPVPIPAAVASRIAAASAQP